MVAAEGIASEADARASEAGGDGAADAERGGAHHSGGASIVCFDLNPSRLPRGTVQSDGVLVMFGDGANAELVRSTGVVSPRAIIVTYAEPARCLSTTQRLHANFPDAPIYARAAVPSEREALLANGASATILESEELAVQLGACLFLDEESFRLRQDLRPPGVEGEGEGEGSEVVRLTTWEEAVRTLRSVSLWGNSSTSAASSTRQKEGEELRDALESAAE